MTEPCTSATGADRTLRILVVDDHAILREGLIALLRSVGGMEVVGEAPNGETAIILAQQLRPDVIIMDVSMPGMGGIEATRVITREAPESRIVGLSMHASPETSTAMRQAGARAYVTKGGPSHQLLDAIRDCGAAKNAAPG